MQAPTARMRAVMRLAVRLLVSMAAPWAHALAGTVQTAGIPLERDAGHQVPACLPLTRGLTYGGSHGFPDPGSTRGCGRRRPGPSRGPEATSGPRAPDPASEPGGAREPADRRAVGGRAPRDRSEHPADLRLPAPAGARRGQDRGSIRRLRPARRAGGDRRDALRGARSEE